MAEELGDLLWYIANVATKFDLELGQIAQQNLDKVRARFAPASKEAPHLDSGFPNAERFPRRMTVRLAEEASSGERPKVRMSVDGEAIGCLLGDNSYDPDGYRFHDVFHLAYAAILGWSPNMRAFLKRKRKSQSANANLRAARERMRQGLKPNGGDRRSVAPAQAETPARRATPSQSSLSDARTNPFLPILWRQCGDNGHRGGRCLQKKAARLLLIL